MLGGRPSRVQEIWGLVRLVKDRPCVPDAVEPVEQFVHGTGRWTREATWSAVVYCSYQRATGS